jgi:glycosyltransferase involved in cell wall biosynthesis
MGQFAVFVPVFNERETIGRVLEQVRDVTAGRVSHLVVADDCSTDGSDVIAARYATHVVRLPRNSGNGTVTRAALQYLRQVDDWDAVIRIDGDGQHDPELLPAVMDLLTDTADVVVCSRFHSQSDTSAAPLDRIVLNGMIAHAVHRITGWPVTDARSGFFGFRRRVVEPVITTLHTERYGVPIELLLRVWHHDKRARFIEIPHPAMYHAGISERLDHKYGNESLADKAKRGDDAYRIVLATCRDLGLQ